jgi:hypothetical protein
MMNVQDFRFHKSIQKALETVIWFIFCHHKTTKPDMYKDLLVYLNAMFSAIEEII